MTDIETIAEQLRGTVDQSETSAATAAAVMGLGWARKYATAGELAQLAWSGFHQLVKVDTEDSY